MKRRKQEKGITLVALVITIIVLLILAGVTINVAIRTGLMSKSENAVDKYLDQERVEADRLDAIEKRMGELSGMKDNTEGTEHTKMIEAKDYSYKNPVIPAGFKTSSDGASWSVRNEEEVSGWNDGLVIEDAQGNQFVWVPVYETAVNGKTVPYAKWCTKRIAYNDSNITGDELPSGVNEQTQIITYGGFYIGRYEAGIPEIMTDAINPIAEGEEATYEKMKVKRNVTGIPLVKKNQVPWNFIDYNKAKTNAESMYNTTKVKSGLLTGTMWDTTMKWLKNSGVEVETDCRDWGNYFNAPVSEITQYSPYGDKGANWTNTNSTSKPIGEERHDPQGSWLLKTGHSEYTKRKNIYDLAGNEWEWTSEIYSSDRLFRGSCYYDTTDTAVSRYRYAVGVAGENISFRVGLYIQ